MQSEGQEIEQRQESTMRIVCKLIVETCNPLAFIGWVQNSISNTSVLSTIGECLKVMCCPVSLALPTMDEIDATQVHVDGLRANLSSTQNRVEELRANLANDHNVDALQTYREALRAYESAVTDVYNVRLNYFGYTPDLERYIQTYNQDRQVLLDEIYAYEDTLPVVGAAAEYS
jgi:hypothetical protein